MQHSRSKEIARLVKELQTPRKTHNNSAAKENDAPVKGKSKQHKGKKSSALKEQLKRELVPSAEVEKVSDALAAAFDGQIHQIDVHEGIDDAKNADALANSSWLVVQAIGALPDQQEGSDASGTAAKLLASIGVNLCEALKERAKIIEELDDALSGDIKNKSREAEQTEARKALMVQWFGAPAKMEALLSDPTL